MESRERILRGAAGILGIVSHQPSPAILLPALTDFPPGDEPRARRAPHSGTNGVNRGAPDHRAAISKEFLDAFKGSEGQAIFLAAREGGYTFGDPEKQNGIFTAAILEALRCQAETDDRNFITPVELEDYVSTEILSWLKRRPEIAGPRRGIEVRLGGEALKLPLAECGKKVISPVVCGPPAVKRLQEVWGAISNPALKVWWAQSLTKWEWYQHLQKGGCLTPDAFDAVVRGLCNAGSDHPECHD